jgi:hypothetical protein
MRAGTFMVRYEVCDLIVLPSSVQAPEIVLPNEKRRDLRVPPGPARIIREILCCDARYLPAAGVLAPSSQRPVRRAAARLGDGLARLATRIHE